MHTIIYHDAESDPAQLEALATRAATFYGSEPRRLEVGIDIDEEELQDCLLIDLARYTLPILADAGTDEILTFDDDED